MKTQLRTLLILTTLLMSGSTVFAQTDYTVISRQNEGPQPTAFQPTKVIPVNGAIAENIVTSTQRILHQEKPFLKKGVVQAVGEEQLSA